MPHPDTITTAARPESARSATRRGQRRARAIHVRLRWTILGLPLAMLLTWLVACMNGNGLVDGLGNVIGGDFAMFYIAGRTAADGQWSALYDETFQQQALLTLIPNLGQDAYLPYRYPPLVAFILQPLAQLPYLFAFLLFTCVSMALWLLSHRLLQQHYLPRQSDSARSAALAIVCAPVILQTWIDGQASAFWFALATACWLLAQRRSLINAGCVLALAACKPNVLLLWGVVLVVRYPRMLLGMIPTLFALLATTWFVAGTDCLAAYSALMRQLALQPWPIETPFWKVQSLLAWFQPIAGVHARGLNLGLGLGCALALGLWWRRQADRAIASGLPAAGKLSEADTIALCGGLLINALCNPYTPIYDLSLLCLGLVACLPYWSALVEAKLETANWVAIQGVALSNLSLRGRFAVLSLSAVLLVPVLSQALSKSTGSPLQFAPIVLLLLGILWLSQIQHSGRGVHLVAGRDDDQPVADARILV